MYLALCWAWAIALRSRSRALRRFDGGVASRTFQRLDVLRYMDDAVCARPKQAARGKEHGATQRRSTTNTHTHI